MKVLGIDPGIDRLGWAVIEHVGATDTWRASGCILTDRGTPLPDRLLSAGNALRTILLEHQPDAVGVEELFFAKNAKTAMMVGQARGMILFVAAASHVPIIELTPNAIKLSVTGSGAADKKQVEKMVRMIIKNFPKGKRLDDEIDAMAVALAAAQIYKNPKLKNEST